MRRATALALLLLMAAAPGGMARNRPPPALPVPPLPPRPRPLGLPLPPIPPARLARAALRATPLLRQAGAFRPLQLVRLPGYEPAPLPDADKVAPPRVQLPVAMAPTLFWPQPDVIGDGFPPGSQHLTQIEEPGAAPPGVKFIVPLD